MTTEIRAVPLPRDTSQPYQALGAVPVRAEGLSKTFGSEVAVDQLTFDVPEGAIFGLIGPSGSGKTTAIRLMTGIYEPTAGTVKVFGLSPHKFNSTVRRR